MRIEKVLTQYRRDFTATMKCEFCGNEEKLHNGYDDRFYHDKVIPKMKCIKCGKSTVSEGGEIQYTQTKYPEGFVI